jgi:hypothetical protein
MKLTRRRAAIAAAAIVLLGFSSQSIMRWIVSCAMMRALQSSVRVLGHADASLREPSLQLYRVQIQRQNRPALEVDRISAVFDPWALAKRHLVVDQAYLDGISVRCRELSLGRHQFPTISQLLPVPSLDGAGFAADWEKHVQQRLTVHQEKQTTQLAELENRLAIFSQQQHLLVSSNDHAFARANRESLRTEYSMLRQAVAEQRIALRDVKKQIRSEAVALHDELPQRLHAAIQATFPDFESSMRLAITECVVRLLNEADPFLEMTWECMAPVYPSRDAGLGIDIPIPGDDHPNTWIRSAELRGWLVSSNQPKVPFECNLSHWGDVDGHVAQPQSHWRFQFPKNRGSLEVLSERRDGPNGGPPVVLTVLRRMDAEGDIQRSTRIAIEHRSNQFHLQLDAPLNGIASEESLMASEEVPTSLNHRWIDSVSHELKLANKERSIRVRLVGTLQPNPTQGWNAPLEYRLDPRTLFDWEPIWTRARANYANRLLEEDLEISNQRMNDAVDNAIKAIEQAMDHYGTRLAHIEEELDACKPRWESMPQNAARIASKP